MRTIVAPAIPAAPGPGDASEVIMVPLLVFHGAGDVGGIDLDEISAMEDLVNVTQVSRVLKAMALPGEEVVVVSATHSLSEHPQVREHNQDDVLEGRTSTMDRRHQIYFGRAIVRGKSRHPPIQSLFGHPLNTGAMPFYRELSLHCTACRTKSRGQYRHCCRRVLTISPLIDPSADLSGLYAGGGSS